MKMIKTILVDDEPYALKNLATLLEKYCPHIHVCDTACDVDEALEKIYITKPHLVILDIELDGSNSFEILDRLQSRNFEIIFITAHDEFGIKAIKHDATDYLLKPIDKLELIQAVEKATEKINRRHAALPATHEHAPYTRLALPTGDGLLFVDLEKIMYCESEGRYTWFYVSDGNKKIMVSKNLGEYENMLPADTFVRIHHHCIINLHFVEKYVRGRGGYVVMRNGQPLNVSARKKDDFLQRLG